MPAEPLNGPKCPNSAHRPVRHGPANLRVPDGSPKAHSGAVITGSTRKEQSPVPFTPPPDYSHHQQAQAEEIKRAQEAQKQWQEAERRRLQQQAEQAQREREAAQRAQQSRTSQRF